MELEYTSFANSTNRLQMHFCSPTLQVVSGITITKFLGVFVLLFAKSQIFEVLPTRVSMYLYANICTITCAIHVQ